MVMMVAQQAVESQSVGNVCGESGLKSATRIPFLNELQGSSSRERGPLTGLVIGFNVPISPISSWKNFRGKFNRAISNPGHQKNNLIIPLKLEERK